MDMYDSGFIYNQTSIYHQWPSKKIIELNSKQRAVMKFLQVDATSMSFENEAFSVIFDKGTLDALMTDNSEDVLEICMGGSKMQRVSNAQEVIKAISANQKAAMVCNGLSRSNIVGHDEVSLDLLKPGETTPRYTIHIVEQPLARGNGKYAAFIVPQGREIEWLFSTQQERRKLLESAHHNRLAILSMHRDQVYDSWESVETELSESIKNLSPKGLTDQIPYLSLGKDVGKRKTLVCKFSKISGDFRIEEVEGRDGKIFRRLIFLSNQNVVQSEAKDKAIDYLIS